MEKKIFSDEEVFELQMQGPLQSSWWTSLAGKMGSCAGSTSLPASVANPDPYVFGPPGSGS